MEPNRHATYLVAQVTLVLTEENISVKGKEDGGGRNPWIGGNMILSTVFAMEEPEGNLGMHQKKRSICDIKVKIIVPSI